MRELAGDWDPEADWDAACGVLRLGDGLAAVATLDFHRRSMAHSMRTKRLPKFADHLEAKLPDWRQFGRINSLLPQAHYDFYVAYHWIGSARSWLEAPSFQRF